MVVETRLCLACHEAFEPDNRRQKRCRPCIAEDRRPTKSKVPWLEGVGTEPITEEMLVQAAQEAGLIVRQPKREFEPATVRRANQRHYRVGVVSDTHLGSLEQQITALHAAYEWFRQEKVTAVLHAGDLYDGSPNMHPGMAWEVFLHTPTAAVDYAVDVYPKAPRGAQTYIISGNHDASWAKNNGGADLVEAFARRRKDVHYLGPDAGVVIVGGAALQMFHPSGGGTAHLGMAKRWIERQQSEEDLPDVLLVGHLHRASILPEYRGVMAVELPALQGQTPWLMRKSVVPNVGAMILDVDPDGVRPKWQMYDTLTNDF